MPRLCEFYPGVCLTTEEKARKNLNQGKKHSSQLKKDLSQGTVYVYQNTHTLQNPHIHTHTHTHTNTHITKQYKTTTIQFKTNTVQDYPNRNKYI